MQFAVPFLINFNYLNDNVQLNIKYKPKIAQLNNFIEEYGSHRINIIFTDFDKDRDFPILRGLLDKFTESELISCFPKYNKQLENFLVQNNIPHYYNEFVTTFDKFNGFLDLKVTDIFIAEELAFSAKILSENAKKKNIALRFYCNVCQSSWDEIDPIKAFFVRPEDIYLYEDFTIEFFINDKDVNKLNVLYEVYTRSKNWFGKISEIITGYTRDELNRCIIFQFGQSRFNCGHRCMYDLKWPCVICDGIAQLSKILQAENLAVQIDKK